MKPIAWLVLAVVALVSFVGLRAVAEPVTVEGMPTVAAKKPARKAARRSRAKVAAPFPGLVRDPLTGLYVKPLAPGQKPISRKALAAALADAL